MKWEYKRAIALDDDELNEIGDKGWELVAVDGGVYHFKRQRRVMRQPSQMELVGG